MKIPASELKALLKQVSAVKNTHLFLTNGGLVAQDSDVTVCVGSDKFEDIPNISVEARKFSSVVNRMSGEIEITPSDNLLTIKSGKAKVEMEVSKPKNQTFSKPPETITLPLGPMKDLLKYVYTSADQNRAAATGGVVQFESVTSGIFGDEKVTGFEAMATDSKRCAYSSVVADVPAAFKFLIPLPAVAVLQGLSGDLVDAAETDSYLFFRTPSATLYANKLSKKFPNYRSFVPKKFAFSATVNAVDFKNALNTVEPMVQDIETYAVSVHFLDGILRIKTIGNGGQAQDEIPYLADPLADVEEFKIKVDHRYLSDYVSQVSGEITFNGNSATQPIVMECGGKNILIAAVAGGSE